MTDTSDARVLSRAEWVKNLLILNVAVPLVFAAILELLNLIVSSIDIRFDVALALSTLILTLNLSHIKKYKEGRLSFGLIAALNFASLILIGSISFVTAIPAVYRYLLQF